MKLYKEPTIMTIATFVGIIIVCIAFTHINDSYSATVDNRVPLPLQVGSKSNPKYSSSMNNQQSTSQKKSENRTLLPGTSSNSTNASKSSSSSSSSLINNLGGKQ